MSEFIATDCKLYVDQYDFSSNANSLQMEYNAEILDATAFGDTTRVKAAGLLDMKCTVEGFFESDGSEAPDDVLFANIGVNGTVLTMCPTDGSDGETSYSVEGVSGQYSPLSSNTIGELIRFTANFEGQGGQLVQGTVLKNGTISATGSGTAYQVGAVSATQSVYCILHVTGLSGTDTPTITVTISSDDNSGMTSATARKVFTAATGTTVEWATPVGGAITDDYWQATWTVSGTDPSMDIVCTMGIK